MKTEKDPWGRGGGISIRRPRPGKDSAQQERKQFWLREVGTGECKGKEALGTSLPRTVAASCDVVQKQGAGMHMG